MQLEDLADEAPKLFEEILGYLNFSSGAADPRFLANLNNLWTRLRPPPVTAREAAERKKPAPAEPAWRELDRGAPLSAWSNWQQAARPSAAATRPRPCCTGVRRGPAGLSPASSRPACSTRPTSRCFSRSSSAGCSRPCCARAPPGTRPSGSSRPRSGTLNDFIGHRPVAVLQTSRNSSPTPTNGSGPIPLFIRGAGRGRGPLPRPGAAGPGDSCSDRPALLARAWFNPEWLDELAVDPAGLRLRSPGQQAAELSFRPVGPASDRQLGPLPAVRDPAGDAGRDAGPRWSTAAELPDAECFRGGGGAGGDDPDGARALAAAGRRRTTRRSRCPRFCRTSPPTATRSTSGCWPDDRPACPAARRPNRRPCGSPSAAPRQHLNQELARRRAMQLQHIAPGPVLCLDGLHRRGRHGQAEVVPVASARMACQIYCLLTAGHLADRPGRPDRPRRPPAAGGRGPAAPGDRVRRPGRPLEHPGLRRPVQPLPGGGKQRPRPSRRRADRAGEPDLRALHPAAEGGGRRPATRNCRPALAESIEKLAEWWDQFASTEVGEVEGLLRAAGVGIGRPRGRRVAGLARGGHGRRRPGLLARPPRSLPLGQGLRPGGRVAAGAARPGGRPWRC